MNYKSFVRTILKRFLIIASLLVIFTFMFVPILSNHSKLVYVGPNRAFAEDPKLNTGVAIPEHGTSFVDFMDYIGAVFDFSLKLGVALTALMLIFAGYKYMTSQGNPSALNEAKDIMIGSLSGFIMLLLVYLILTVYNLPTP